MRNLALLERTMTQIRDHPELHEQGVWFAPMECGTAACFAGWVCLLSGYEPVGNELVETPGGWEAVPFAAEDLLGLNAAEADVLFDSRNSRHMLELMVKDLVNGDVLRGWSHYREMAA